MKNSKKQTEALVVGAILTALIFVLQMLSNFTGGVLATPITLVLIPIVIGGALYGPKLSTWLGFASGVAVLATGAATLFFGWSPIGTIVTVIAKGTACGFATGMVYRLVNKISEKWAIWAAAVVCPIVNTGIFVLGCYIFFINDLTKQIAELNLPYANATAYIFFGFAGINFLIELGINVVLNPAIKLVLKVLKKQN